MPVTEHFGFPYPLLSDQADVPADMKAVADAMDTLLFGFPVENLGNAGAGDAGKILVVGPGGINAWRAMSGDATLSSIGALTIGTEKITSLKIQALAITEALIEGEAVSTGKIKALAVTAAKLAAEAVESAKIKDLAVTTAKLNALAVTTAKLADLAVTTAKLAAECVTEGKLADKAVTSRKLDITHGTKTLSAEVNLKESNQNTWVDLTGMSVTLELPYASRVVFEGYFTTEMFMSNARRNLTLVTIAVNGVQGAQPAFGCGSPSFGELPINYLRPGFSYRWEFNMAANTSTTFKAQGLIISGTAGNEKGTIFLGGTFMSYEVFAQ